MGNKSSSNKDPHFGSEARGRSRSFNGLASRFRKTSRSPPRDRSSSFGESGRPQRKGSGRTGQNGTFKTGQSQNGHAIRRGHDIPIATLTKSGIPIPENDTIDKSELKDSISSLSKSAPGRPGFHHRNSPARHGTPIKDQKSQNSTPVKSIDESPEINEKNVNSANSKKALVYDENDIIIKSSNLKNLKNKQLSDKPELIENYADSPRLSVTQMRNVSRELFSDQLEDLAKRRGMATLNRDLSLSNASLGLLSNRSKSMHSLSSNDWDYEERCNVGELLSFADSSKVGELCRSITSQFSSENQEDDTFLRPRTNSASAIDLGRFDRNRVAMGATSAEIRRSLASQYAIDPNSSQRSTSTDNVAPDVIHARRMLVSRALKDDDEREDSPQFSQQPQPQEPAVTMRQSPTHAIPAKRASSPSLLLAEKIATAPGSVIQEVVGQKCSPVLTRRSSSPRITGTITSEKIAQQQGISPGRSSNTLLQNIDKNQLLAANMTKSMQKFLLENQGVGTNSTNYEKLHDKLLKKKKSSPVVTDGRLRERSSSFSVLTSRQQQEQFVQQMIDAQQEKVKQKQEIENQTESKIVHVQCKSYDSTPVSTGGDSGFRSRSQSWSSLSRKSMYESQQQISSVINPVNNLWSYSEVSLAELPVDLTSQPQRFISNIEDDGPVPINTNFSHGRFLYLSICCLVLINMKKARLHYLTLCSNSLIKIDILMLDMFYMYIEIRILVS